LPKMIYCGSKRRAVAAGESLRTDYTCKVVRGKLGRLRYGNDFWRKCAPPSLV
jgi:hypothetical protein